MGNIGLVQGEAVLIHQDEDSGYWAANGLSIYQGDTVITLRNGRIRLRFDDGSIITMASSTRILINQSSYDPKKKERSAFIRMGEGKSHFKVKKLPDFKRSAFKIKTSAAIIGVKGSEFVIETSETGVMVTTFEETLVEIMSSADTGPVSLSSFERTWIKKDALPSRIEQVSRKEALQLKSIFEFTIAKNRQTKIGELKKIRVHEENFDPVETIDPPVITDIRKNIGDYELIRDHNDWMVETHGKKDMPIEPFHFPGTPKNE